MLAGQKKTLTCLMLMATESYHGLNWKLSQIQDWKKPLTVAKNWIHGSENCRNEGPLCVMVWFTNALCCIFLGRCFWGLETRVIIKILSYSCCPINVNWFSLGCWFKKTEIFNSPNLQYFFMKISGIGSWVSRINWWVRHLCDSTYMAVRLSDVSSKKG